MESAVVVDFVGMWVTRRVIHISMKIDIKYISYRYIVYIERKEHTKVWHILLNTKLKIFS